MASVLMINLPPEKQDLLRILSFRLNFACRDILPREQFCRICDLLKGTAPSQPSGKPFLDEMLVMDGFSNQDLNFLLNEMIRTEKTIPLKAVTTPTNLLWTVSMLHTQLVAENRELSRRSREASK